MPRPWDLQINQQPQTISTKATKNGGTCAPASMCIAEAALAVCLRFSVSAAARLVFPVQHTLTRQTSPGPGGAASERRLKRVDDAAVFRQAMQARTQAAAIRRCSRAEVSDKRH